MPDIRKANPLCWLTSLPFKLLSGSRRKRIVLFLPCLVRLVPGKNQSYQRVPARSWRRTWIVSCIFAPKCNCFIYLCYVSATFVRTLCQVRLGNSPPEFLVSSASVLGGIHHHLKEAVMSCRFSTARFCLEYLTVVWCKIFRSNLCDVVFLVPLYRWVYCAGHGQDVLKRVKSIRIAPSVKHIFNCTLKL